MHRPNGAPGGLARVAVQPARQIDGQDGRRMLVHLINDRAIGRSWFTSSASAQQGIDQPGRLIELLLEPLGIEIPGQNINGDATLL